MIILEPGYRIMRPQVLDENSRQAILTAIEDAARVCYKSERAKKYGSASEMVQKLVKRRHFAMLEHAIITVHWTVDVPIGREMTRHRIASYAQESTRYCNYANDKFSGQISVIRPYLFE